MKVNLDAQWLEAFAERLGNSPEAVRLRQIAEHIETLDQTSAFDRGYQTAMNRYYGRSNIVSSATVVSPVSGEVIQAALANGKERKEKPDLLDTLGIEIKL